MIVKTIEEAPFISREDVLAALRKLYGSTNANSPDDSGLIYSKYTVNVRPVNEPPFQVLQLPRGQLLIEGTPEQNTLAAAAIRDVLPANTPRVIALSEDMTQYVDLTYGITADDISRGWTATEGVDFSA